MCFIVSGSGGGQSKGPPQADEASGRDGFHAHNLGFPHPPKDLVAETTVRGNHLGGGERQVGCHKGQHGNAKRKVNIDAANSMILFPAL